MSRTPAQRVVSWPGSGRHFGTLVPAAPTAGATASRPTDSVLRNSTISELGLWLTVGLALLIRVGVVLANPHYAPHTDALGFDLVALSLARTGHFSSSLLTLHGGPSAFRPPVFCGLLALVYDVVGTGAHTRWEAGRLLNALLGAGVVALIWPLARRLAPGRRAVAWIAGLLAAVYPPFLMVGSTLLPEPLFMVSVLGAVLAALAARDAAEGGAGRRALGWAALTGLLVALIALTRANGLLITPALLWLVWLPGRRRSRRGLALPATVLAATVIGLLPWTVRNAVVFHQFIPTTTELGYSLEGAYNGPVQTLSPLHGFWEFPLAQIETVDRIHPHINEAQLSNAFTTEALHYIRAHPVSVVRESYWNLRRLLDLAGYGIERGNDGAESYAPALLRPSFYAIWALGLLALGGAVVLQRQRRRGPPAATLPAAVWWCPLLLLLSTLAIIGATRYRIPIDPFLLLPAAVLLDAAGRAVRGRVSARTPR